MNESEKLLGDGISLLIGFVVIVLILRACFPLG